MHEHVRCAVQRRHECVINIGHDDGRTLDAKISQRVCRRALHPVEQRTVAEFGFEATGRDRTVTSDDEANGIDAR